MFPPTLSMNAKGPILVKLRVKNTGAPTVGFALGGPVFIPKLFDGRNRLWFHTHYEGTRQIQKFSQRAFTPTAAMFRGDFSEVPQPIYNPFNFDESTGLRAPFPTNQIPPNLITPVAKNLWAYC